MNTSIDARRVKPAKLAHRQSPRAAELKTLVISGRHMGVVMIHCLGVVLIFCLATMPLRASDRRLRRREVLRHVVRDGRGQSSRRERLR
jgi:hypothetical protein